MADDSIATSSYPDIVPAEVARHVAPLLPPTAEPPLPLRTIGFIKSLLFFWIVPRRYGSHLAAGSWKRAIVAHIVAMVLCGLAIGIAVAHVNGVKIDWTTHSVRYQLAQVVIDLAAASASTSVSWLPTLLILGAIPVFELSLVFLGILLMPWCADGDGARSVFRRSVKNVLWTTTALLPWCMIWLITLSLDARGIAEWLRWTSDFLRLLIGMLLIGATIWVVLRCLLLGASRYAGEPDGPAFRPRKPHCDQCGYLIVGLPLTSACPECGLAVCDSLPGGRRQITEWQKGELSRKGFADLLKTQWVVLSDPTFFTRLPVQNGLAAARHFWWGTFLLLATVALVAVRLLLFFFDEIGFLGAAVCAAVATMTVPILAQMTMMFVACLWSQMFLGMRDYRVSASVCYYASPLVWPLAFIALLTIGMAFYFGAQPSRSWVWQDLFVIGFSISFAHALLLIMGLIAMLCVLFWWSRLSRALRNVRYANV